MVVLVKINGTKIAFFYMYARICAFKISYTVDFWLKIDLANEGLKGGGF
jgi:hypothetical protein